MRSQNKMAWIDVLRGVAVMLVIASHAMPVLSGLPWTVKRVSYLGFFGVQLFFVVSCLTLARSWRGREASGPPSLADFALRRVFRIVPAYFLAALLYWWLLPHPPVGPGRLATFLTFTGGWNPSQMPTVAGAWPGVPGGWSIEAEMSFYVLFPLLVTGLRGPGPACAAALCSLPLAWLANAAARAAYMPVYGSPATEQFLYYWLPNQLPVFLVGLAAYEIGVRADPGRPWARLGAWLGRHAAGVLAGAASAFVLLAWSPVPRLPEPGWAFVDESALAALVFASSALALRFGCPPWARAPLLARLGEASFSAYLLHFAVIEAVRAVLPPRAAAWTGIPACLASLAILLLVLTATFALSRVTYRLIELPAIRAAELLSRRWHLSDQRAFAKT